MSGLSLDEFEQLQPGTLVQDSSNHLFFLHHDGEDLPGKGWVCECGERWTWESMLEDTEFPLRVVFNSQESL